MRRSIQFAIPTSSDRQYRLWANQLETEMRAMAALGYELKEPFVIAGSGFIGHVRNIFFSHFMAGDATDLIMLDDDNWPQEGGLLRLLHHPVDFVGLPIRAKCEEVRWNVGWKRSGAFRDQDNGLIEVEAVGTGIIRITRAAGERILEASKDRSYFDLTVKNAYDVFPVGPQGGIFVGEDIAFCKIWRALGGKIWVDPDVITHHIGDYDFSGSLGSWLARHRGTINVRGGETGQPDHELTNGLSHERFNGKTVALVIASRGNPKQCAANISACLETMALPTTKIVVGLDSDDPSFNEYFKELADLKKKGEVLACYGDREDTIGAVYNRCAKNVAATYYIDGADDVVIKTPGWDAKILEAGEALPPDGICCVFFGKLFAPSAIPGLIAVSRAMIDRMGYFIQPYTPYWWVDTWLWEIAGMTGRIRPANIDLEYPPQKWKTRGLREVNWWANFFNETRPLRVEIAKKIIMDPECLVSYEARQEYIDYLPELCEKFYECGKILLDPEHARKVEAHYGGFDAPADDRYLRVKARAQAMLDSLQMRDAAE